MLYNSIRIRNFVDGRILEINRIMSYDKAVRTAKYFQRNYDCCYKEVTEVYFRAIGDDKFKRMW